MVDQGRLFTMGMLLESCGKGFYPERPRQGRQPRSSRPDLLVDPRDWVASGVSSAPATTSTSASTPSHPQQTSASPTGFHRQAVLTLKNPPPSTDESPFVWEYPHAFGTRSCGMRKCGTCPQLNDSPVVESYISKRPFATSLSSDVSCHSENVVYVISCAQCGIQYVGETGNRLQKRFADHRRKAEKQTTPNFLYQHFSSSKHGSQAMSVQVLEKLPDNTSRTERLKRELFWIQALNTAFPFGLNDSIHGYGCISQGIDPMEKKESPYFCLKMPQRNRSHGRKHRTNRKSSIELITDVITQLNSINRDSRMVFRLLMPLSRNNLKLLWERINLIPSNVRLACKAIFARKLYQFNGTEDKKNKRILISVEFPSKGMERINLHTMVKDRRARKLLNATQDVGSVIFVYKYPVKNGLQISNQGKLLNQLDTGSLQQTVTSNCSCQTRWAHLVYGPVGHVITTDFHNLCSTALVRLLEFGAGYRSPVCIDWPLVQEKAEVGIEQLVKKLAKTLKRNEILLQPYKARLLQLLHSRIKFQKKMTSTEDIISAECGSELKKLNKDFVITTVDKATNNFVFICKKYYLMAHCKELGVQNQGNMDFIIQGNEVYHPASDNTTQVLQKHSQMAQDFGLEVGNEDLVIPKLFGIPKLHKTPYKFRFIAGASHSSCKNISVLLCQILLHLKNHFRSYCSIIQKNCGYPVQWSVNGSLEALHKADQVGRVMHLITADFSTLFTSLPHDVIKNKMFSLVFRMFQNSGKPYLIIKHKYVFYAEEKPETFQHCFTKEDICSLIEIVVDNTFVRFAGILFQQTQGVPMGGNASPLLADLTLSYMEFEYLSNPMNRGYAICMQYTVRYVDDLLSINCQDFLQYCKQIYPDSLPLEETSSDHNSVDFLDLTITGGDKANFEIYNKTDSFPFAVVRFVHSSSNVHCNLGYNTFFTQLIRFGRIYTQSTGFTRKCKELCTSFLEKGYKKELLQKKLILFGRNYAALLGKHGFYSLIDKKRFSKDCFQR